MCLSGLHPQSLQKQQGQKVDQVINQLCNSHLKIEPECDAYQIEGYCEEITPNPILELDKLKLCITYEVTYHDTHVSFLSFPLI